MRVDPAQISISDSGVRLSFPVYGLGIDELWFRVSESFRDFLSDSCDAALVTLLIPAMLRGQGLTIHGPVSKQLLWNLSHTVVPVLLRQRPFLSPIRLEAESFAEVRSPRGSATLAGLSCGIDFFASIADHLLDPEVPARFRVTHFVFNHLGQHGGGPDLAARVESRWQRAQDVAGELGLPVGRVDSNAPEFYPSHDFSPLNWAATLTVRSAAVPLLLQSGVRRFFFAGSNEWQSVRVRNTKYQSDADPILLPALSTENVDVLSVGVERTRVEKTYQVAQLSLASRYLDVCNVHGRGENCSRCEKCVRTAFTLDALGHLEAFRNRFDLDTFRRHRDGFLVRALAEKEFRLHAELRDLVRKQRVPLPKHILLGSTLLRCWRWIPHGLRRKIRRIPPPPSPGAEGEDS